MSVALIFPIVLYLLPTCVVLLYLLSALILYFHKVWWNPIHIQNVLASQGIKGPPYKFLHGNNKEVINMLEESMNRPIKDFSHNIFPNLQPHIYSWMNIYGKNFLTWRGPKPQLIVTEPDLIKEILINRDGVYLKPNAEGYLKMLLGNGLSMIEGQKWSRRRKLANHAFHADGLKGMIPAMIMAVEIMLERWRNHEGKEIEVFEECRLLTSEVISRTAFGSSYAEGKNIFEMLIKLGSMLTSNSLKIRFPGIGKFMRTGDEIESEKIENKMRKLILEIIKTRQDKMKKGELMNGYGSDYLGLLLKANQDPDENKSISIEDVIDECKSFYFAGHETTTSLLTWTCLLLAIHTDWQDKARKEVIELIGENNPTPDENCIAKLKKMNMIIKESLRLYPPVLAFTRRVAKEIRLGNLILPANLELVIYTIAAQHEPKIWGQDVHVFKPERFSEGVVKATLNNAMAFLPFGSGPRICVGSNFAMIETKIALAMILQRYHFTISPTYVHSPIQHLTTRPQHGLQIVLHAL